MNKAENALLAKAHALYAKRLTSSDYSAMLMCRTNSELLAYLQANTSYAQQIEKISGSNKMTRARFELILRNAQLDRIASLCRFEKLIGEKLYRYFIVKNEIETIIYSARHLDTGEISDLSSVPPFYKKEQSVSGEELSYARSFEQLSQALTGTPYKSIVDSVISNKQQTTLAVLENALYEYLYSRTADTVSKSFKGRQREEILDYFRFVSDMIMIEALYRLNSSYAFGNNYKANAYISAVSAFTPEEKRKLAESSSGEEILEAVNSSCYKKYFEKTGGAPIEHCTRKAVVKMCAKKLRYSQNPIVCMLCYSTIAENEIKNITHIIEGIKYNLSPDEISEIIVKGEC